ncbi:hypothetical protein ACTFIW_005516 [Dictyostelium discoideum]
MKQVTMSISMFQRLSIIRYLTWSVHTYGKQSKFTRRRRMYFCTSSVKTDDTDLLFVEKRINNSLKPLLLMSIMLSSDRSNVDVELISYLTQSAIVLAVNAQASLCRVHRNNIAKEIYGSEVFLPIKITDKFKNLIY